MSPGTANCGLTAAISVSIDGNLISVSASGSKGAGCYDFNLYAQFAVKETAESAWEVLDSYNGSSTSWNKDFTNQGYYAYRAYAKTTDKQEGETHTAEDVDAGEF